MKFWENLQSVIENLQFALFAALAKALLQPLETRAKTISVAISTIILGTLIGQASLNITWLKTYSFAISTACGLFGKELFDYALEFIKNRDKLNGLFQKKTGL